MSDISRVTVNLLENGYFVNLGGVKDLRIESVKIPDAPIERDWFPNIKDYLVMHGNQLVDGMVVILNDKTVRWGEKDLYHCLVTKLKFQGDQISFVGIYADGTAVPHRYNQSYMWAVEKGTEYEIVEGPRLKKAIEDAVRLVKAIESTVEIRPDDEQAPAEELENTKDGQPEEENAPVRALHLRPFDTFDLFGVEHVVTSAQGYSIEAVPRVSKKSNPPKVRLDLNESTRIKVLDRLV